MQHGQGALDLEPRIDAAARARRHVRALLEDWGLEQLMDPVLLLTSEVVTNALLHSGTSLTVLVTREGAGVRVEVRDGSTVPPVQRRHSLSASTGRGVRLLSSVAEDWGWLATPTGKRVWFIVLDGDAWGLTGDLDGEADL